MELESTRIFVKVVHQGSFSKAATLLKLPLSTVSRTIRRLEDETGTKLLLRTTRSLKLTAAGHAYLESVAGPIQLLEDARRSLQGKDSIVAGTVKISAPDDLGKYAVTPAMAEMMKEHPHLSFDFFYTDQVVDLITEGFDLAVRIGTLKSSGLRARKVGEVELILVATPEYLAKHPLLKEPKDLSQHNVLLFFADSLSSRVKLFAKGKSASFTVPVRAYGNQMESLLTLSYLNAGISIMPHFACKQAIAEKKLIRVLPEWTGGKHPVHIVTTGGSALPARVQMVSDHLTKVLGRLLK